MKGPTPRRLWNYVTRCLGLLGETLTFVDHGCLWPVYVRGEAYLAGHQGNAAVAEFQKFLDHRSLVSNCPTGALAHLGLARAYAMQGDAAKARAAYQDFLHYGKTPTLTQKRSTRSCKRRRAERRILEEPHFGELSPLTPF
jgi:hypothetical protein